jgi:hypothetical protein
MSRTHLRKIGSLLGLLAILMSVLAPTISQTLAAQHRPGHMNGMHGMFGMHDMHDMHGMFGMAEAASDASTHGTQDHSLAHHLQACAYCGLLAHVPVLPGAPIQLAVAVSLARVIVAPPVREVRALVVYTAALPRAPPAFS